MQFFLLIAVAASFSLRQGSTNLLEGRTRGPGGKGGKGEGPPPWAKPPMDETVMWEPEDDQVLRTAAESIIDNIEHNEDCSDAECNNQTVEICEELWAAKLKICIEKAEEWAYICPAPTYMSCVGYGADQVCTQKNCKKGCCSPAMQDVMNGTDVADAVAESVPDADGEIPGDVMDGIEDTVEDANITDWNTTESDNATDANSTDDEVFLHAKAQRTKAASGAIRLFKGGTFSLSH